MMEKVLEVTRVASCPETAAEVPAMLDACNVGSVVLDCQNWSETYHYKPSVSFRIAHSGEAILIDWRCNEDFVRAEADDNGRVWEDSCVEFFISFDRHTYYNIECNCRGAMLCGYGNGKNDRELATPERLAEVKRYASLGQSVTATQKSAGEWRLSMIIPLSLFFKDAPASLDGIEATANFYKCGDLLPDPHFLSWSRVETATPDFHRPEFFGKLNFMNLRQHN